MNRLLSWKHYEEKREVDNLKPKIIQAKGNRLSYYGSGKYKGYNTVFEDDGYAVEYLPRVLVYIFLLNRNQRKMELPQVHWVFYGCRLALARDITIRQIPSDQEEGAGIRVLIFPPNLPLEETKLN